jgi:hypothetical protein
VLEYRGDKDAYTTLAIPFPQFYHVLELEIIRDSYDRVREQGVGFEKRKLVLSSDLKALANEVTNLNFTTKDISHTKFLACYRFQEDFKVHQEEKDGLLPYLLDAASRRLLRSETRNIREQMLNSSYKVVEELQDENPLHRSFIEQLLDNIAALRLD